MERSPLHKLVLLRIPEFLRPRLIPSTLRRIFASRWVLLIENFLALIFVVDFVLKVRSVIYLLFFSGSNFIDFGSVSLDCEDLSFFARISSCFINCKRYRSSISSRLLLINCGRSSGRCIFPNWLFESETMDDPEAGIGKYSASSAFLRVIT